MSVSTSATLMLRPDVVATVLEDGAVLLDLETKYFFSVNQSGWAILQLFEIGATRPQVVDQCRAWGVVAPEADGVLKFLDTLLSENLITALAQPSSAPSIEWTGIWTTPTIEKHREPLQRIMISAFDPTLPLAE